jgi:hypothetical protein
MEDGAPSLGVGFEIDTDVAFGSLVQLDGQIDQSVANAVAEFERVKRATAGMVNLGGATSQIVAFGNAGSREFAAVAREAARVEKTGEGMVRQLQRQIEVFGKTASEVRNMRAEMRAAAAEERGLTELAGRIRATNAQLNLLEAGTNRIGSTGRLAGFHMQNLAFQFQDLGIQMAAAAGSSAPLKMAFMALMQQGTQIQGIMSQAGVGIREVGSAFVSMTKSVLLAAVTNPVLLGIAAAVGVFAGTVKLLQNAANDGADMKKYAESLGLTAKEIRHLNNVTVTWGDTAKAVFQVAGRTIWDQIGPSVTGVWGTMKSWLEWIGSAVKTGMNFFIGVHVGAFNALRKTWQMLPAVMGDAFYSAVNAAIGAINVLVQKAIEGLNWLGAQANKILPSFMQIPELKAPQIAKVNNEFAGAGAKFGKTLRDEITKATNVDYVGKAASAVSNAVTAQAIKNAQDRIRKQAEAKGYLDPEKPKTDKHAEQLAREAAATEAQIRNLYALAAAYKVSGAAALIAEARVKAESKAIRQRADIEAAVDREVRLAIAQRVSDAAKATASIREQAAAQERINQMVAAGLVPAERAAESVRDQIEDLPLLAAMQAAQQRGLATEAAKATAALADQRRERERLAVDQRHAQFLAANSAGKDRLDELREELRLLGQSEEARVRALALLRATQEARAFNPEDQAAYIKQQVEIAGAQYQLGVATNQLNQDLRLTAERADEVADAMSRAFGRVGSAIGDAISILGHYGEQQEKIDALVKAGTYTQAQGAKRSADLQMNSLIGITGAAKNLFKEHSKGYQAMAAAEKALTIIQLARTAVDVAGGAARMFATLGPFAFPAVAAMLGVMASLGFSGGSGASKPPETNTGTGTVFGDSEAKSESIKRAIDSLKEVDTLTNTYAREMAASLRSIDSQIGNVASLVVRAGDISASAGVNTGFKSNASTVLGGLGFVLGGPLGAGLGALLTKIPIVGDILKSLFGTKTTVVGSGLFGGPQSIGSVLGGGFDAEYFSDVKRTKKFFGIGYSTKYRTEFANADPTLENQFTLILRSFNDAILAAAGPLGAATSDIQNRLNSFIVNIGKIDLKDLTGTEIQEKLSAVFGAAADQMAAAAFPGLEKFQKVGEGAFETLVRVASTVEQVTNSLDLLGTATQALGIDAKMGLADQFDSIGDLTNAAQAYFERFYTKEEQVAARTAQLTRVFTSLGLTMPASLDGFRALVEAQNLTTDSGRATYAMLLQLAPAFADLQSSMAGAKSAADILSERQDLQRKLLELQGDTAAIRALDLAKLDVSNRALQQQIWALQDAQEAAKAADELRKAWTDVGTSIMDEVKRIRGLTDPTGDGSFASLMGQFNAATSAARGGDQDAAKQLPALSQALLKAAADAATSRQELERVQAQTAASLEATFAAISAFSSSSAPTSPADALLAAMSASQAATSATATANDNLAEEVAALRSELAGMRADMNSGQATIANNTGRVAKKLDDVTAESGGTAVSVASAA